MDDLLADFVAETREMLEASQGEIVAWEADPADSSHLDAIFRFVHTVKGNCGFFDFPRLANLSHAAEDALGDVRAGRRETDSTLVNAVLAVIDRIVELVDAIEAGAELPSDSDEPLIAALQAANEETAPSFQQSTADEESTDRAGEEAETSSRKADATAVQRTIRLPVTLLDRVMSGVSDMVLARNDLAHRLREAGNQPTIDGPFERLTTILADVRDAITRMRMQRIETLYSALPRLVRDLSAELGKQVMVDLEGGDVELDREMIEMVRDPLTHIIRNAIDHGIESPSERLAVGKHEIGVLSIAARQSGNKISIVITDDGGGLSEEKIASKAVTSGLISAQQRDAMSRDDLLNLIFEPGFSTAEEVSSVSGRGVGLDVVRDNLEKVGGSIRVSSTPDHGTLFYLQIPLTLSIIAGLTVKVDGQRFAIPQSYVEEIVQLGTDNIEFANAGGAKLITFRNQRIPCISLATVLDLQANVAEDKSALVLLRMASGDLFALAVDSINNISDLVVKPLPRTIMATELYGGSTLLDDGQPILVLDVPQIAFNCGLVSETRVSSKRLTDTTAKADDTDIERAMLFTDLTGRRSAVRLELVQRIETVQRDAIDETGASLRAVVDGTILPLVGAEKDDLPDGRVRLLRLSDGDCELLLVVSEIEDAVVLKDGLKPVTGDPLVEAVTLIENQTVSLINGHELFARYGEPPEATVRPVCQLPDSDWARTILGPLVAAAGYDILTDAEGMSPAVSIVLAEAGEAETRADGAVIRLRSQPDADSSDGSIYRYDRAGLVAALRNARAGDRR
ncbi:MAG: chemotaxis protein CheA [Pseudomonadota bacterium]